MNATHASPGNPESAGLLAAHGQHGLSMAGSFWWRFVLPLGGLLLLADGLASWLAIEGSHARVVALALLVAWPLLIAVAVWGGVGTLRAASAQARAGGRAGSVMAVRAGVALGVLVLLASLVLVAGPQFGPWWALSSGHEPLGDVQVRPSPDGRRLRLQGAIGEGAAARLAQALAAAPGVYLLELDAPAGRHAEGRALAVLVQARRLQTRVVGACDNACLAVFMAGSARQVAAGGRLVLNRWPSGAANPLFGAVARHWQAGELRRLGLPEAAIVKAMATTAGHPWVLEADELLAHGLVGVPGRPLDVPLPPTGSGELQDYLDALASHPAWRAFEAYRRDTIAAAGQALADARAQAGSDDAAQVAAQRTVQAMLPDLVRHAGPALREQYVALLQLQLEGAKALGVEACSAVLAGDAAARRGLPAPAPEQETDWLLAAAAEPSPAPPRPLTALESEVLRHALGERAAPLLGAIRHLPRGDGRASDCERASALIADVLRLPAPERRLAVRLMFDRG